MDTVQAFSLFDRTVARPRPVWVTGLIVLLMYLPMVAVAVDMGLAETLASPRGRSLFTAPTVIAYIVVIAPILARLPPQVIRRLRPVILVDDQELTRTIAGSATVSPAYEFAAMAIGLFLGILIIGGVPGWGLHWTAYVQIISNYLMCGLLGWLGLVSIATTRVIRHILRLPLRIDPLDIGPFEAIGRQSLIIALAFVGGNTLGLLLGSYGAAALTDPRFWVMFGPLFLLPVAVFFLNMLPTQRILAQARKRELAEVAHELNAASRLLLERRKAGEPVGTLPQEVNALATFELRLKDARSWPYNTAILRTLLMSIVVQLVTVLARQVMDRYIR